MLKQLKFLILVLSFFAILPALGFGVGSLIKYSVDSSWEKQVSAAIAGSEFDGKREPLFNRAKLQNLCWDFDFKNKLGAGKSCSLREELDTLNEVAATTLSVCSIVLVLILLAGLLASRNRALLLFTFHPVLVLTQTFVIVSIVVNAGLLIASIYFLEAYYIGRIHSGLMVALGLGAALTCFRIIKLTFKSFGKLKTTVLGKAVRRNEQAGLWSFIENIAKDLGTEPPRNIVVGLEPNFFVTEVPVLTLDGQLDGRTLFLSLPFLRVLNRAELTAIVGHEFGHFIGADTKYSKWFFPIYRSASSTSAFLHSGSNEGLDALAALPAALIVDFFIACFSSAKNKISRERELIADLKGASIATKLDMATSLLKVHAYLQHWNFTDKRMLETIETGKSIVNLSAFFAALVKEVPLKSVSDDLSKKQTEHPVDSHPPLYMRIENLGFEIDSLIRSEEFEDLDFASNLIDDVESLEKNLSDIECDRMIRTGRAKVKPEEAA